jgi:hypothetical protein
MAPARRTTAASQGLMSATVVGSDNTSTASVPAIIRVVRQEDRDEG